MRDFRPRPDVAEVLPDAQARELSRDLLDVWEALHGPPRSLSIDFNKLKRDWFGPRVTPKSLRDRLEFAPTTVARRRTLEFRPRLMIPTQRVTVVTPEGRLALEQLSVDADAAQIDVASHPLLTTLYREWSQEKLTAAVANLDGQGELMYPVSIGAVLVLLCHGAYSEQTALVIPRDVPPDVAEALCAPLLVAVRQLDDAWQQADPPLPGARRVRRPSEGGVRRLTFEGYPVGRAKERLGERTIVRRPQRGRPVSLWVEQSEHERVISVLAEELVVRRKLAVAVACAAIRAIVAAYEASESRLQGNRMGHRQLIDRDALVNRIERRIERQAATNGSIPGSAS